MKNAPLNNITEAGHQAGAINVGLAGFAVLLVLALLAIGVARWIGGRPIDHIDGHCIYYADGRAPVAECSIK